MPDARVDCVGAPVREDEQPGAVKEQLVAPGLRQLQGAGQARLPCAHVDREKPVGPDDEQRRAVRLDQVGLVDALLLHVRRRVVDAGRSGGPARLRRRDHRVLHARHTAEPPRPNERQGMLLRVGEQAGARAEGLEARADTVLRRRARRGGASAAGSEQRQHEDGHQDDGCSESLHLICYTPPGARMSLRAEPHRVRVVPRLRRCAPSEKLVRRRHSDRALPCTGKSRPHIT